MKMFQTCATSEIHVTFFFRHTITKLRALWQKSSPDTSLFTVLSITQSTLSDFISSYEPSCFNKHSLMKKGHQEPVLVAVVLQGAVFPNLFSIPMQARRNRNFIASLLDKKSIHFDFFLTAISTKHYVLECIFFWSPFLCLCWFFLLRYIKHPWVKVSYVPWP
jgi:hypothetical protein